MAAIASAGAFGVQLFFLLSAFLITSLLLREKVATGDIRLRAFYLRRILRIWPLYFFALALAAFWPLRNARMPLNYLAAYLLLAGNWMTVFFGAPGTFMSILWSVSIEEQFYLSWPFALKKASRPALITIAICLILIANVTRLFLARGVLYAHTVWPNTFAELDPIALGILCAIFLNEPRQFRVATRLILAALGLLTFTICGHFSPRADAAFALFGYPAVSLASLALFMAIYGLRVRFKPLIYLGKVSFGLYVYHLLALYLLGLMLGGKTRTSGRFAIYWCGALALTIFFASASYRWLESPFLHLKERFAFVKSRPV
jgi:peptidoglycan/LPS O-acetylase OafA/YrhL